jgi:potassium/hydrogen antiporter
MGVALALVLVGLFFILAVVASKASSKLGIPALVFFIGIGMLAGSDGPGGFHFDDVELTANLGTIALAFILFAGGLETNWTSLRSVIYRGLSLATLGVALTALFVGLFAHYFLGFTLLGGLLLGAVVSSTDAAAVFGVLRTSGLQLKHRITPLLEFESGTNDPLAVFMTIALIGLLKNPDASPWSLVPQLLLQMPLGVAFGYMASYAGVWVINRVRLEYDGLYPVVTIATACIAFGGASLVGGNAFLAVYVAGVAMGSRNFLHRIALLQFHDAIAWLMQITMFVVLGLLVFPKQLGEVLVPGIALSLFLMFFARPVAVFTSLMFSRMTKRARFFVAWAGLRGAVPIILATFPLMEGLPQAQRIFNLVFFIVLTSVVIQGTSLRLMARWLGVLSRRPQSNLDLRPVGHKHLLELRMRPDSPAVNRQIVDLNLPQTALIVLLTRDGASYIPRGGTVLRPEDVILVATRREDQEDLRVKLEG